MGRPYDRGAKVAIGIATLAYDCRSRPTKVMRIGRWYSRPATPQEAALEMPEELWVAVLVDPAGRETVYPVDAVEFSSR